MYRRHIANRLGHLKIASVKTEDIQELQDGLRQEYSGSYCRLIYLTINEILKFAVDRGKRSFNPLKDKSCNLPPCRVRGDEEVPTIEEVGRVLIFLDGEKPFTRSD